MILTQNSRWFCSKCSYFKNSALNLFASTTKRLYWPSWQTIIAQSKEKVGMVANLSQTQSIISAWKYGLPDWYKYYNSNWTCNAQDVLHQIQRLADNLHFSAHPSLLLSSTKFHWIGWFYYSNNEDISNKMTVKRWPFWLNLTHLKTRLWQLLSQG